MTMSKGRKMDLGPRCYNCDVSVYSYGKFFFYCNVRRACGMDAPEIPYLNCTILTSCHQPFPLAMKRHRGHIRGVALESGDLCFVT